MSRLLVAASALILLAYPVVVYFAIHSHSLYVVSGIILVAMAIRVAAAKRSGVNDLKIFAQISGIEGLLIVASTLIFQQHGWLTFYPVAVNACMLGTFAYSLLTEQTIIERLARIKEPDLPIHGVIYTRKVTIIWCLFFFFNGLFALYTCFHSLELWTLYNGLISYILMGALFIIELIFRQYSRSQASKENE